MTEEYRVQLDVFTGPLDLLLYLIRRDELDIQDIPLARLTAQYLEYVRLLEQIDPNTAGDFLVMASTLIELKSRALLPTPPLEAEDDDDPRKMLVKQLLEYKRFKDAAEALGSAADVRAQRYIRLPADLPRDLEGVELEEAQVWDLLSAFGRVMSSIGQGPGFHKVVYDDTPIEEYKMYLLDQLENRGTVKFLTLFDACATRSEIIGVFLAILELIRGRRVRAEQDTLHGEIYLFRLEEMHFDDEEEEEAEIEGAGADSANSTVDDSPASELPRIAENPDHDDELDLDEPAAEIEIDQPSAFDDEETPADRIDAQATQVEDEPAGESSPDFLSTQPPAPEHTERNNEQTQPTIE